MKIISYREIIKIRMINDKNLQRALKSVFHIDIKKNSIKDLSKILIYALRNDKIKVKKIQEISDKNYEDLLFFIFEKKLLIPTSSYRGLEWQESEFLPKENQEYKMPIIIKNLTKLAMDLGIWNSEESIVNSFNQLDDKDYKKMPMLVNKIYDESDNNKINGHKIKQICKKLELEERAGTIISELKATGIMSPLLSKSLFTSLKNKSPLYELNPSLFD